MTKQKMLAERVASLDREVSDLRVILMRVHKVSQSFGTRAELAYELRDSLKEEDKDMVDAAEVAGNIWSKASILLDHALEEGRIV